jgi:hypothetical protein
MATTPNTLPYTNIFPYTITIISTNPIVVTTTEYNDSDELSFDSALEMARFFGIKVAEVRKALKG